MSIFKDDLGNWSSKRTVGLSYALLGILMVIGGIFLSSYDTDIDILIVVIGTALTALGISSIPKKPVTKGITPPPGTPPPDDDPDN